MAAKAQYNFRSENHPVSHVPQPIVLRKAGNTLDVFHGNAGFRHDEWTRFQMVKIKGQVYLKFLKGATMPQDLFAELLNKFKEK